MNDHWVTVKVDRPKQAHHWAIQLVVWLFFSPIYLLVACLWLTGWLLYAILIWPIKILLRSGGDKNMSDRDL